MKGKLSFILSVLLFFAMVGVSSANTITVDYYVNNSGYQSVSGSFKGVDANNDGLLVFTELTDWFTGWSGGANFGALNDIGDFNYINNVWTPNAYQWNQVTQDAYMTWDNWSSSVSTSNYNWNITTTNSYTNAVPEPASLLLLGLGLVGLAGVRRKLKK